MPDLTLHVLTGSHPARAAEEALAFKGLGYERVVLVIGEHQAQIEELYGEGKRTVPGLMVDGEPVHGSRAIFDRLEEIAPEPTLYPAAIADAVREAETWGADVFQDQGRRIFWGAMHFRPNGAGTFGGPGLLDPAQTDFAITLIRRVWKGRNITAGEVGELLAALPAALDRIDGYVADGVMGGETPTAADLQIGSTLGLLGTVGDIRPLIDARPAGQVLERFFGDYEGNIPAGAFPDGWVPAV